MAVMNQVNVPLSVASLIPSIPCPGKSDLSHTVRQLLADRAVRKKLYGWLYSSNSID
jgi:hypothetical protein